MNFENLSLHELSNAPEHERTEVWEQVFLSQIPQSKVKLLDSKPHKGPDTWPYMLVSTGEGAEEPAVNLLKWLSEKGIGLVINPEKTMVDYALNYGMIWNFRERGRFINETSSRPSVKFEVEAGSKVLAGPPSDEYLPPYVRRVLKTFWVEQAVLNPRILVVSQDSQHFDLCFSLESLGNPPGSEQEGIAQAVAWFLPIDYSIVLVSEKGLPEFHGL